MRSSLSVVGECVSKCWVAIVWLALLRAILHPGCDSPRVLWMWLHSGANALAVGGCVLFAHVLRPGGSVLSGADA